MIEPWVLVALAAAAVQTARFALQKTLKGAGLSAAGATFSRFLYAAPLALVVSAVALWVTDAALPPLTPRFWAFAVIGGLGQIVATMATVQLFSERNFAVGIAFTKTEPLLVALFSFVLLGERISSAGFAAILVGAAGVVLLSWRTGGGRLALFNRATGLGLLAGALFGLAAIGYRGATLEVPSADPLLRAGLTLAAVTLMQAVALTLWLVWREPGQVGRVIAARRTAVWMGLTGMAGSLCWFTAFTLQNAAMVFAVGQVEVIFSLLASVLVFGERITRREGWGIALVTASVLGVVALR